MSIQEPIFAVDGDDVTAFPNGDRAGGYLEVDDIASGAIRVFKADGTELRPRLAGSRVTVTDEEAGKHPEFLARALRSYLRALPPGRKAGDDAAIDQASLAQLVDEVLRAQSTMIGRSGAARWRSKWWSR